MNRKHEQSIYHANVNVDFMEENVIQINGGITINADVPDYIWNPSACSRENGKYLASIIGNSVIMCD